MRLLPGLLLALPLALAAQERRALMPIEFQSSADAAWARKQVHARRDLRFALRDSLSFSGTGVLSVTNGASGSTARVEMRMFRDSVAPTRNRLSSVHLRRNFDGQDWREYNRLAIRMRPHLRGFTHFPIEILIRSDGAEKLPDRYNREGIHYVTLLDTGTTTVYWEIDPLPRDRVRSIEFNYWMNKMVPAPGDTVAFAIEGMELQRVDPDVHTGWLPAPGRIAYSHSGYEPAAEKVAIAAGIAAREFTVSRASDNIRLLRAPVRSVTTSKGTFQLMDFSAISAPGEYVLSAGSSRTRAFRIGRDAWDASLWKSLNFLYGNRCGDDIPGVHPVDHKDWFAILGRDTIVMNGGWHDAGDLSQGVINTGELTWALFELAERLRLAKRDPALVARVIEEAKWGLDWVMKVRFPGGYRMYFAPHNLWTDNVKGTPDDRSREPKNNPNANYITAAALAKAWQVLKDSDPALAGRALAMAREDWEHAIVGVEGPATRHTPAFAATQMELASIGTSASVELFRATREQKYADKAAALARIVSRAQQKTPVGSTFPLSGFFFGDTARDTLFHQFHRGNDQAPVVALAQLLETFPSHADAADWTRTLRLHLAYQKRVAGTTAPWYVHPAYVYREADDVKEVADSGALHNATREAYREMVRAGMPMGDGWYLRAFPVWFARRGNYGVLLSQAKALSVAGRLFRDSAATGLARAQLQWVVGRNPFTQSTMFGEGHDWHQQYSVSSGDFVGSLPVGMQSRGHTDLPYWSAQNMYVYKEVWVHSTARWLWIVADLVNRE
jgi:hypothetical protein